MHIILKDVASNRTEHHFDRIEEAAGQCGHKMPLICDGRAGVFEFLAVDSTKVRFVETDPVFQYFAYAHLPEHLQRVSKRFYDLAESIVLDVPRNPERTVALRKLLEAKDAAVRARLAKD
jgi:hypothetical protein